jgi:internalin A
LSVADNELEEIPPFVGQLSNLKRLELGFNRITQIPTSLAHNKSLEHIGLSGNQISVIPDSLATNSYLQRLDLSKNRITAIPNSISQLSQLVYLNLSGNLITTLRDSVSCLSALNSLDLSHNQIDSAPTSMSQLTQLQSLDLRNNRLTSAPEFLGRLPKLTALFLHGNPDLKIPNEILGPTPTEASGLPEGAARSLLSYLVKLGRPKPLNEAKLILVGQGGVGKTSLVKKLTTGDFESGEESTLGIRISDWDCVIGKRDRVTVHIWDFGGQEMMHATHQFFLTARSLYLLVLNRRLWQGGPDKEADYWFRLIRAFGGRGAPVIVVLNKQKFEPFDVNRGAWLEKYPENIVGFIATDCMDPASILRLKRKIQEELRKMKSLKDSFPRRWFAIKDELSHMRAQYVTFEEYRVICRKHGEEDAENQNLLAAYLHDLGVALNYKDDPTLRFYILRPAWVTDGIYTLLHAFVKSKGLFSGREAERVLSSKGYSKEATHFILGLMEQFELSFQLDDNHKRILIPQLLDDRQPEEANSFKRISCLNFGYRYTIVPDGLLPRFIVRTHHLSEPAMRWKSGVILRDPSGGCRALVRADFTEAQVHINIDGIEAERPELLRIVRYNFDVIHSAYESRPTDLVYPKDYPETAFRLDKLRALASSGSRKMSVVLPDQTVVTRSIAPLLEPVKSSPPPIKLFLSYSHKDEEYAAELLKDLKLLERNGIIRSWYDRALNAGEKWEARILQELSDADVIICQLSRDFLSSDFCVLTELDIAIRRAERREAKLIAYVLRDCGWREVPKLCTFQILPQDARPLTDWKDKNKYWRAVAEGIQNAIKVLQKEKYEKSNSVGSRHSASMNEI